MSKTHFTFEGKWAGMTYCAALKNEQDTYMHIKAANTPIMKQLLHEGSSLCKECKRVYHSFDDIED